MNRTLTIYDDCEVSLELDKQILTIDLNDSTMDFNIRDVNDDSVVRRIPANIGDSEFEILQIIKDVTFEDKLVPSLVEFNDEIKFGALSLFALKAKQVDDRIYATVEKMLQDGTGRFVGKSHFLNKLAILLNHKIDQSPSDGLVDALAFIRAANELGGVQYEDTSQDINIRKTALKSKKLKQAFLQDSFRATPVGFYTKDDTLKAIFLQDRFLQKDLETPLVKMLAQTISGNEDLLEGYKKLAAIYQRLSNPYAGSTVLSVAQDSKLLPASRAHETDIVKKLFGSDPIPNGFNLMTEMIQQIRDGRLNLKPLATSGWYDYQTYALEPFLLPERCPESNKLKWGEKYLKYMEDMFVSLLAATRETHVKQLESVAGGCAAMPVIISPDLSIEPLPEYYLRKTRSYQFIHNVLLDFFGEAILLDKAILPDLLDMEELFYGAYEISCEEIGLDSEASTLSEREKLLAKNFTRKWLSDVKQDQDVGGDIRAMVPLFFDIGRQKIKVLAILGYSTVPIRIDYHQKPEFKIYQYGKDITSEVNVKWCDQEVTVFKLEATELYVDKLWNRDDFRAVCDKYKTKSKILNALSE